MRKLTLTRALLLTAAAAAHAQSPAGPPTGSNISAVERDPLRDAMRYGDGAKAGEAMIEASRASNVRLENEANVGRRTKLQTFKAEIEVTNSAVKTISAVIWRATLLDPKTGAVIRYYDVTTSAKIAPGKTKKLSKQLTTPRANQARTGSQTPNSPNVADLKVKVTGVTYEDGSFSPTP